MGIVCADKPYFHEHSDSHLSKASVLELALRELQEARLRGQEEWQKTVRKFGFVECEITRAIEKHRAWARESAAHSREIENTRQLSFEHREKNRRYKDIAKRIDPLSAMRRTGT